MTDQERREKEQDLQALREVKEIFEMPGWAHMKRTFEATIERDTASVMATFESGPREVETKGRVRQLRWLLDYPNDIDQQIKDLTDELADSDEEQPDQ